MQRRKERIDFYIRTNDTVDKEIPSDNIDYLSRIQRMLGAIYVGVSHVFYVNRFHSLSGASRSDQMFEDISIISNHFVILFELSCAECFQYAALGRPFLVSGFVNIPYARDKTAVDLFNFSLFCSIFEKAVYSRRRFIQEGGLFSQSSGRSASH